MQWHTFDELTPDTDKNIVVELKGCKIAKYWHMKYRENEGTAHYVRWCYHSDYTQEKDNA